MKNVKPGLRKKLIEAIIRLVRQHNTPHEIALGIAIGVFIATLPVYGLHTVMVIVAAILVRPANKIAILAGTNFSLPPTVPFITWTGYEIGKFILRDPSGPLQWSDFKNITFTKVANLYPSLFVGSFILGIICAVMFYFISFFLVKKFKERRKHAKR